MDQLIENLRSVVGQGGVLAAPDELLVYECDGFAQHKFRPRAVIFPRSTEEVAEALRVLARARVPFAPRGAGTGLSGGALARDRGVIIEMARMRQLLKFDPDNRLATVQTGMVNAQLSRAAASYGLQYVPDPSSQAACTIGGNIAENAGGIHCLKYGMTVDHVLAARVVLSGGEIVDLEMRGADTVGYDLLGVFIGSEGTFGIATEATLRLVPIAPAVQTILAVFDDLDRASRAVSAIIAAGLVPSALEMIDGVTIRAVEASVFAAGIPKDAEAALLIELDGLEAGLDEEALRAEAICREHGARSVRRARDERERKKLWAARKGAFGAMGRVSPDLVLQDAVVPRSRLPEVLAETYRIGAKYNLLVANVFHAGDGNLHPFICFDARNTGEVNRVKQAGREMMETCVRAGGTITGEHGVGLDKSDYLPLIFSEDDMDAMLRVRAAFDPSGLCNPGKIIPTSRSCGEARGAQKRRDAATTQMDSNATVLQDNEALLSSYQSIERKRDVNLPGDKRIVNRAITMPSVSTSLPSSLRSVDEKRRALAAIVQDENVKAREEASALVVAPASTEEACEVLRLASSESWTVAPAGNETWMDVGNIARRSDLFITTRRMNRIIEHEPADLVATAEAGVTLNDLNAELGRFRQWLPLDPPDDGRATIGGVAATGLAGAHNIGYGAPRNFVIGMRVALADGRMIKAGGRVVKNVAGYDLCKLFVGSYGTLCLILEITFKLRPVPAQTTTLVAAGDVASLLRYARSMLAAPLLPVALEILSPKMAEAVNAPVRNGDAALLIRFAGAVETVKYQVEQAQALSVKVEKLSSIAIVPDDARLWRDVAEAPLQHANELILRANMRPIALETFLNTIPQSDSGLFSSATLWHAGAGDGRLRIINPLSSAANICVANLGKLRDDIVARGGILVVENASIEVKKNFDVWSDVGPAAALMQRIKSQLDPAGALLSGTFFSRE